MNSGIQEQNDKSSPVTGGQLRRLAGLFHKWIPGQPKYDSCLTSAQGAERDVRKKLVQPSFLLLLKGERCRLLPSPLSVTKVRDFFRTVPLPFGIRNR